MAGMAGRKAAARALRHLGGLAVALNLVVVGLSLGDMYILASGAVRVGLPDGRAFDWRFDPERSAVVILGNYTLRNGGFYDITGLDIGAVVLSAGGARLVDYQRAGLRVPAFGGGRYPIVAVLPVERLLALDLGAMLFNGTYFDIRVRVDADYIFGLAHFHSEQAARYPWSPPLQRYWGHFANGSLERALRESLPLVDAAASTLVRGAAAAMLAEGQNVSVDAGPLGLVFHFEEPLLNVSVRTAGPGGVELFRTYIQLPAGGGAPGA